MSASSLRVVCGQECPRSCAPCDLLAACEQLRLLQGGGAATELRAAFGVRGACSRFQAAPALRQRQQAGRTPNASRGSSMQDGQDGGVIVGPEERWAGRDKVR